MGLWVIGIYKLAKAAVLLAAGVVLLYLARNGVSDGLAHVAFRLRLNPEDHIVHTAASWIGRLDQQQLELAGFAVILYGLLYVAQSVGLLFRCRWGAYLIIVNTGFLIPLEGYEAVRKPTLVRFTILVVNVAIVLYLVWKLRRSQWRCAGRPTALTR